MNKIPILLLSLTLLMASCAQAQSENDEDLPVETEKVISMAMDNPNFNQTPSQVKETYEEDLSGNIILLDDESFAARITDVDNEKGLQYKGTTPCIVDFYADWCRPCNALHPVLVELAKEYKGKLIIYKINTDKSTTTANALHINSIPTLLFFKRNAQPGAIRGGLPKKDLKKVIDQFLEE
ncbi:MAG: thiol reductase thioredoxin [Bacteroidales bacterium]|nr:thiol reductase thioredoxin [Bacteroidales bacterium]